MGAPEPHPKRGAHGKDVALLISPQICFKNEELILFLQSCSVHDCSSAGSFPRAVMNNDKSVLQQRKPEARHQTDAGRIGRNSQDSHLDKENIYFFEHLK